MRGSLGGLLREEPAAFGPQVRVFAAEQLWVHFLSTEDEAYDRCGDGGGAARLEAVREVLSDTQWEGSPEEVAAAAGALYAPLGLARAAEPLIPAPRVRAKGGAAGGAKDENSSYRSLVDDAGY